MVQRPAKMVALGAQACKDGSALRRHVHRGRRQRRPEQGDFFGGRGAFSVRWNAEGTTPPVDVKRGDGRFNYYPVNLYSAMYFIITTEQK